MPSKFFIKKPWITEKAGALTRDGKYVFIVEPRATKNEVKKAVKELYKVSAVKVHIIRRPAKAKRFRDRWSYLDSYKKAIVTLKKGETIAFQ